MYGKGGYGVFKAELRPAEVYPSSEKIFSQKFILSAYYIILCISAKSSHIFVQSLKESNENWGTVDRDRILLSSPDK